MPDPDRLRQMFETGKHPLRAISETSSAEDGFDLATLAFKTAGGESVRGFLTKPKGASGKSPAILHVHAHGNKYQIGASELVEGRPALQSPPGPAFAKAGFVTLCIDLPCFGERSNTGESAAAKAALWRGTSLAGQMLGELSSALDWLCARTDVDASRIGCFGISMGATLGYWLAAVDTRIAALVQQCCLADFAALISTGAHDLHGIYLSVPGLLNQASNGQLAGMVAPRPQLVCLGDLDPLTPPHAADIALAQVRSAYSVRKAENMLELVREANGGHAESAQMRAATLGFFKKHLV